MSGTNTTMPTTTPLPSLPVQVYANRGGAQIFSYTADATGGGKPMMSSDLDDVVDGLRALNALQGKMTKFVKALAAMNDVDEATITARIQA